MRGKVRLKLAIALGLALGARERILAQDWPQWLGPSRDCKVAGFEAPQTWPEELTRVWRVNVGQGEATPALAGDRLYVFAREGDEEILRCLDAAEGNELWAHRQAARAVTGPASPYPGPRSSPAVSEGKVVCLGVGGAVTCLDAATGRKVWDAAGPAEVPRFFTAMSPLVVDGRCIVHWGGENQGAVTALSLATGAPLWSWPGEGPAYASPALLTADGIRQAVVHTEKRLIGLDLAEGKLLCEVATHQERGYWNSATPVVDGGVVFYTGQGTGTRALRIARRGDGFAAEEIWHNPSLGTCYNTPVLKDGLLFGVSDRGYLFCLDARTGATRWKAPARVSPFAAVVDAGAVLFALPAKPVLAIYKPDGASCVELAKYTVADAETYAFPIVAGRRVFVRDRGAVTLWTFP